MKLWPWKKKDITHDENGNYDPYWMIDNRIKDEVKTNVERIKRELAEKYEEAEERSRLDINYNTQLFFNPEQWCEWLKIQNAKKEKADDLRKAKSASKRVSKSGSGGRKAARISVPKRTT